MSKSLHWIFPHATGILAALLAGTLLSSMTWVEFFTIPLTPITGSSAVRLLADAIALGLVISFAVTAYEQLPDNGRGSSFFRTILFPFIAVIVLIFAGKALRANGLPLIQQIGLSNFLQGYTIAMVGSGLWLTVVWLRHLDLLRNAFAFLRPPASLSAQSSKTSRSYPTAATRSRGSADRESPGGRHQRSISGYLGALQDPQRARTRCHGTGVFREGSDDPALRRDQDNAPGSNGRKEKLQEIKARFFREAESAGRLSHPNIVTIYDAGEEHDLGYIAMEFVEGNSLKDWSRKPTLLPLTDIVQTLASVADALDYAHQQGVIHRDIKPANIMITKDRLVKVMDFGIAKMASSNKTQTDVVLGTPTYMSPEQIAGKKVDGRSDVFSLGVVLFELLTGQPPSRRTTYRLSCSPLHTIRILSSRRFARTFHP